MSKSSDIIDLTNSFNFPIFCGTSNIVIDLDTDDSFCIEASIDPEHILSRAANDVKPTLQVPAVIPDTPSPTRTKPKLKKKTLKRKSVSPLPKVDVRSNKKKFGGCPICWDELGKNPLASTKCGHVYCMKCLQEYLKREKKCPTCRQILRGSSAFHPLYLSKD